MEPIDGRQSAACRNDGAAKSAIFVARVTKEGGSELCRQPSASLCSTMTARSAASSRFEISSISPLTGEGTGGQGSGIGRAATLQGGSRARLQIRCLGSAYRRSMSWPSPPTRASPTRSSRKSRADGSQRRSIPRSPSCLKKATTATDRAANILTENSCKTYVVSAGAPTSCPLSWTKLTVSHESR